MYVNSYIPYGYEGIPIRIEADIRRGLPGMDISGLADGAVREAKERIQAAFRNSGYQFPNERVLINLAPAGVRKNGAALDLPIACAVMGAASLTPSFEGVMILGELELCGRVRPVRGVLAAAACAMEAGVQNLIVPFENKNEAEILFPRGEGSVSGVKTLKEAVFALEFREKRGVLPSLEDFNEEGFQLFEDEDPDDDDSGGNFAGACAFCGDFSEVRGQERYKRALMIAAAGAHNLLVFGPPGAGKTMLARRLPSIMPPLEKEEAVTVTRLYSLASTPLKENQNRLPSAQGSLITRAPFRSPHHSASAEGILGGGKNVRPGEISLAHFGVLFLDEAPEFKSNVLQALREPLEDKVITISRAEGPVRLPADFQLVMAANPCPCGKLGALNEDAPCLCSADRIHKYWRKFSGALLDRIELRAAVKTPALWEMSSASSCGEEAIASSHRVNEGEEIALAVRRAVLAQKERYKNTGIRRNAALGAGDIGRFCHLNAKAEAAFQDAAVKLGFSGRAYHGTLRVARTIADIEGKECIESEHILEAIDHRRQGDDPFDILQ